LGYLVYASDVDLFGDLDRVVDLDVEASIIITLLP